MVQNNNQSQHLRFLKLMVTQKTKYAIGIIYLCISMIPACAVIQGKSIETYNAEYSAAVQASADALENMEIPVIDEVSDEIRTEFLARRADGTPVTVEVKRVDENFTQVSVGTGGGVDRYLDPETANLIHGFIRDQLSKTVKND